MKYQLEIPTTVHVEGEEGRVEKGLSVVQIR